MTTLKTIREASRPAAAVPRVAIDVGIAAAVTNILIYVLRAIGVPEDLMGDFSVLAEYLVIAAFAGGTAFVGKVIRERQHTEKQVSPVAPKLVAAVGQGI